MTITKENRRILIIIAAVLLIAAAVLTFTMTSNDEFKRIADVLNSHGYQLAANDIAAVGGMKDTTIAEMLKEEAEPMDEAVAASKAAGFPSNINARGDITLLATQPSDNEVVLIFMRGEEIELCFSQSPDGKTVFAIGGRGEK